MLRPSVTLNRVGKRGFLPLQRISLILKTLLINIQHVHVPKDQYQTLTTACAEERIQRYSYSNVIFRLKINIK